MSDRKSATSALYRETEAARMLCAAFHDILGEDEEARHIAIASETNITEAIEYGVAELFHIKGQLAGNKAQDEMLKARRHRLERREERLRDALLVAMDQAGLPKVETPVGTVSKRATPPSVVVTNESEIPAEFWKRADPTLDKKALLAALKELPAGEHIAGAQLSNGGSTIQLR